MADNIARGTSRNRERTCNFSGCCPSTSDTGREGMSSPALEEAVLLVLCFAPTVSQEQVPVSCQGSVFASIWNVHLMKSLGAHHNSLSWKHVAGGVVESLLFVHSIDPVSYLIGPSAVPQFRYESQGSCRLGVAMVVSASLQHITSKR